MKNSKAAANILQLLFFFAKL
ncbi:hypothetical protein B14911_25470 [Bacillus sp. NRRL B-14911]|nr:hypothetical protein B14911_25470 [Bacillus sp. NRRL B-14911]